MRLNTRHTDRHISGESLSALRKERRTHTAHGGSDVIYRTLTPESHRNDLLYSWVVN